MTGGGPQHKTETLVSYIYDRGFKTEHDLGYASAISVYLFIIIAIITVCMRKYISGREATGMREKEKVRIFGVTGNVILCIVALLVFIPLLWLIVSSFKTDADVIRWPPAFLPEEWLTAQYEYVVDAIPILSMLKNTVVFAGSVTLSACCLIHWRLMHLREWNLEGKRCCLRLFYLR